MKGSNRSKRPLPVGHAHAEQGFVQGVLLFALAVLVAIIAAFAFANNGNQSSSERENAKVTATVLMKQASDVQDAVSRYISDGLSLMYLCVTSETSPTVVNPQTSDCANDTGQTPISLFSVANGYITPPVPPAAAFKSNESDRIWRYADFTVAGRTLSSTLAPDVYAFMQAENLDKKVCQGINRMLNKAQDYTLPTPPNDEEICYLDSGTGKYVYRKVIASRKPVGA